MRFVVVRSNHGQTLVCDTLYDPIRVLCVCTGYAGRVDADYIIAALNAYNDDLYGKFRGGTDGKKSAE